MNHTITVNELQRPNWKAATFILICLSAVFFITFWNTADVLWAGIYRLVSFVCFAGAVICGLKAMEGGIQLKIEVSEKTLSITYQKKGEVIQQASHELNTVHTISSIQTPTLLSQGRGNEFIIRFKDSDEKYDLFHFGGRTIKIDQEEAEKLIKYFADHDLQIVRNKQL